MCDPAEKLEEEFVPDPVTRLKEYTKDEWWDLARKVRPDFTQEEFDKAWDEFQEAKARRSLLRVVQ